MKYSMTTNGTIINAEQLIYITENINDLSISIDGKKETHDRYRIYPDGKSTFDKILKQSKKLLKMRPDIRARLTVCPDTVKELFDNIMYLLSVGFKTISPALDYTSSEWNDNLLFELESQLKKSAIYLYNLPNNENLNIGMIVKNLYELVPRGKCSAGKGKFSLWPNGDIYPCLKLSGNDEFCIGNIEKGLNIDLIEEIQQVSLQSNSICDGCHYMKYCNCSRCKLINKFETGNYYEPLPLRCAVENITCRIMDFYTQL